MNGYALVAASGNHKKPLPSMAISRQEIATVNSGKDENLSTATKVFEAERRSNDLKLQLPEAAPTAEYKAWVFQRNFGMDPMRTGQMTDVVTTQLPSYPGLDPRWCFYHGADSDYDQWFEMRSMELERLNLRDRVASINERKSTVSKSIGKLITKGQQVPQWMADEVKGPAESGGDDDWRKEYMIRYQGHMDTLLSEHKVRLKEEAKQKA